MLKCLWDLTRIFSQDGNLRLWADFWSQLWWSCSNIIVCECYGSRRWKKVWASNLVGNSSCFQVWSLWLHFLTQQIDEETHGKASNTWSNVFTWYLWLQNHYQYFHPVYTGIHMKKTPQIPIHKLQSFHCDKSKRINSEEPSENKTPVPLSWMWILHALLTSTYTYWT